jgi:hypothetical protein
MSPLSGRPCHGACVRQGEQRTGWFLKVLTIHADCLIVIISAVGSDIHAFDYRLVLSTISLDHKFHANHLRDRAELRAKYY